MTSFVKFVAVFAASLGPMLALAEKPADEKTKPAAKEAGEKKKKNKKQEKGETDPHGSDKAIDVPVPKGHDAKGLKIPYFDSDGRLQMTFNIGVASRLDDNHIQMSDLQIETFDEAGEREMSIDLPTSVLDLTTSVISTEKQVTISRDDFDLTGKTMQFNTKTRQGGLGGGVKMVIKNLNDELQPTPTAPPPAAQPVQPEAK